MFLPNGLKWINMKVELKDKVDDEAQQYKFRPRAFKIEDIIEVDISTLGSSFANASFSKWQELISDEDITERVTIEMDKLYLHLSLSHHVFTIVLHNLFVHSEKS